MSNNNFKRILALLGSFVLSFFFVVTVFAIAEGWSPSKAVASTTPLQSVTSSLTNTYNSYILKPGTAFIEKSNATFTKITDNITIPQVEITANVITSGISDGVSSVSDFLRNFYHGYIITPLSNIWGGIFFNVSNNIKPITPTLPTPKKIVTTLPTPRPPLPPNSPVTYVTNSYPTTSTGSPGPRGPQGLQGLPGPQGMQGLQGPRGLSASGGGGNNIDTSSFVSKTFFNNQIDRVFDSIENGIGGLSSSLAKIVNTITLSVSGNASVGGGLTVNGQGIFTRVPTFPHAFAPAWPLGTSNVADSSLYINPATAATDTNLLGVAVGGVVKFLVDADGNVYANNMILNGSVTSGATTVSSLSVLDNTILGNAPADTVTIHGATTLDNTFSQTGANTFSTGTGAVSLNGTTTLSDVNVILGTTTGTKFGTATSQKLAFYNSTPIVQPTGDVATALSNLGLVATPTIVATTNANLTGAITSVGNATSLGSFTFAQLNTAVSDADVARTDAANTFTGVQTMTSPALTTPAISGISTGSGVATANTINTLVLRDGSGNFSAGTITAALTGNASTATNVAVGGITGLGTGVGTALAVNVGTAGAFVVNGGAGGTPSSLTLTNATGLPSASVLAGSFGAGAYVMDTSLTVPLINGSSADNGDITINGTSSATKTTSYVILQATGGNVGIGTVSPVSKLTVADANITSTTNDAGNAYIYTTDSADIDKGGLLTFGGSFQGTTRYSFGSIAGRKESATVGEPGGYLQFSTTQTSVGIRERMRITSTGNVGIGTTNPVTNLHVLGGAGNTPSLSADNGIFTVGDTTNPQIQMGGITSDPYSMWIQTKDRFNIGASYPLSINPLGGNVGIGTTSPADILHLTTGNLRIGASTAVRATTAGTNQLILFNGTAPVGTLTNGVSFYSSGGEAFVIDAGGTATQFSPHDKEGKWVFNSTNAGANYALLIDMESMMKKLNQEFGWDFVHETIDGVSTSPNSSTLVSLQELDLKLNNLQDGTDVQQGLFDAIIAKFSDIYGVVWENGILQVANVVADKLTSKEVYTNKLCIGETCVTESELKELLEKNNIDGGDSNQAGNVGTSNQSAPLDDTGQVGEPEITPPPDETPPADGTGNNGSSGNENTGTENGTQESNTGTGEPTL